MDAEIALARQILDLPEHAPLVFNDVGWTSRVYLYARGELVVKFPRDEAVKQEYALECAAYRLMKQADLASLASVCLPELRAVGTDFAYLAYAGVVGQTLDQQIKTRALDDTQKKRLGQHIGLFLKQLHGLSLTSCPEEDPRQEVRVLHEKYQLGLDYLKAHLSAPELEHLDDLVQHTLPKGLQDLGYERVLSHGDLGFWNMVYQETPTGPGLGIIDFGDIGYYDASRDFVGLSEPLMLEAALAVYGDTPHLRAKITRRQKILPILELPYHLGKGNRDEALQTLQRLRIMQYAL